MVDKLQEQEPINNNQEQPIPKQVLADVITSHNPGKSFTAECVVYQRVTQVRVNRKTRLYTHNIVL
jgi:hypothetical protein